MVERVKLDDLVDAITAAGVNAQKQIQDYQISNLMGYFDERGRPRSIPVNIPYFEGNETRERRIDLPVVALVPLSNLCIKEMEVNFDVELNTLSSAPKKKPPAKTNAAAKEAKIQPLKAVNVSITKGPKDTASTIAHVHIKMEGVEPREALNRILDHLNKTI